nr:hypothetical protein [Tanacetum cinerariifolium]
MDQLEKQLDNEEFQEIGSMAAFKVLETLFQLFIKSRIYLDDEYVVMTRNYFLQYTQLEIPEFRDTLIQHMESSKKSIDERAQHKQEYDSRWDKISRARYKHKSWNDAHADDVDSKPVYDEEPMAEVQLIVDHNAFAIGQQHTEQPKFNNKGEVDQNAKQCHDTCHLLAKLTGKPVLQPHRNQSVVRQLTAFKSERPRISKPRFASQVNVNNDLSKPVTTHYLPKKREYVVAKPHHMIAPGSFSAGTSINVQEEGNLDLSAGTPFNLKKERIKTWIKEKVISGRPRLHGTTSIQEISARPKSQGI